MEQMSRRTMLALSAGGVAGALTNVHRPPAAHAQRPDRSAVGPAALLPLLDLQGLIDDAIATGAGNLQLPAGRHRLDEPVWVYRADGLTIDGNGAELVATFARPGRDFGTAITFEQSSGVTLRDMVFDFDPLPFTQGRVVAVDVDGGLVDLRVHRGYRSDVAFFLDDVAVGDGLKLHAFSPTDRTVKRGHAFAIASSIASIGTRLLRFDVGPDNASAFAVGDLATTGCWRFSAITTFGCGGMVFDGVTIWASGGAAILERDGEGGSDVRIAVVPGPPPPGATQQRLVAASRDAYHAGDQRRGALIHDSVFRGAGDDMVHVFMNPLVVTAVDAATRTIDVTGRNWGIVAWAIREGDTAITLATGSWREVGRSTIVAIERVGDTARFTLADLAGIDIGLTVHVPEVGGVGLTVRDCSFANGVSTAIMVKSHGARVTGNSIEAMGQGGITVATDFDSWWGGPFAQDVELRGNTITDVGRSRIYSSPSYGLGAAIVIGVEDAAEPALVDNRQFRNIRVVDNVVERVPAWAISISNADGVDLSGNRFTATNQHPPGTIGAFWGTSPDEVVYVRDSSNVRLAGNVVEQLGPYASSLIRVEPGSDAGPLDSGGIRAV